MSRPVKCRRVCHFPQTLEFLPQNGAEQKPITLTIDEYEAVRLIDKEGLSQEECAASMAIARTTVQRIYESARKKLADCIVDGRPLCIAGGDFQLCKGENNQCRCAGCYKQQYYQKYKEKGAEIMRIAVTYQAGEIFQHFGHTEQFKVYDVQKGNVVGSEVVDTNGNGHGALVGVLHALNVDVLICGGIGAGAQMALAAAGIKLYGGASGSADDAVTAFLADKLVYDPDVHCDHHDHEHGGEVHSCGEHGCGKH